MLTIIEKQKRELLREAKRAVKRLKTVRRAADYIGMPHQSFYDYCGENGIKFPNAKRAAKKAKA